ncbi:MAG: polysaccharide deacetylase family protein [Thermodesulfobacteriota bacterium]
MTPGVSALWRKPLPKDLASRLDERLSRVLGRKDRRRPIQVFFRADDIGVPGEQVYRLIRLFLKYRSPLNLAVVPAWLTAPRWRKLREAGAAHPELWCWHQHGWRHVNHEPSGKKQEFGPARSRHRIRKDLAAGFRRLEELLGRDFTPVFTPPWNRCSRETIAVLSELGYAAFSASPAVSEGSPFAEPLPNFCVQVDLHTRKESRADRDWIALLAELESALSQNRCGIVIHHRRMNDQAFRFLETLLERFAFLPEIRIHRFTDMRRMAAPPFPEMKGTPSW